MSPNVRVDISVHEYSPQFLIKLGGEAERRSTGTAPLAADTAAGRLCSPGLCWLRDYSVAVILSAAEDGTGSRDRTAAARRVIRALRRALRVGLSSGRARIFSREERSAWRAA